MKRIAIVNDSMVLASMIQAVVKTEPGFEVVGVMKTGLEALENIGRLNPDLVLMDIHMPVMDGVEATHRILVGFPRTRILITTATLNRNMRFIFDALKYGALDFVRSPALTYAPGTVLTEAALRKAGSSLLSKIKISLSVSKPIPVTKTRARKPWAERPPSDARIRFLPGNQPILSVGCSTGGPTTLVLLLNALPKSMNGPVLVCQHIEVGFDQGFANWVARETGFPTEIARDNVRPLPNNIYVAPAGKNMVINGQGLLRIESPSSKQIYTPNIDRLFHSIANYAGIRASGVILTGMGNDGASGIKALKEKGGACFIQDERSSIVDSMPRSAMRSCGCKQGYPPEQLGVLVGKWINGQQETGS